MISSATAPPFLGSWASVFVIWLTLMFGLSCVVHLASLVLFPALLAVPGALAWSLYVGWLRAHTPLDFDHLFFKMATYGFWNVLNLVGIVMLIAYVVALETVFLSVAFAVCRACIEETAKVSVLRRTPLSSSTIEAGRRAHKTLVYTMATALGYAISCGVGGMLASYMYMFETFGYQSVTAGGAALAVVIRLLSVAPLHALCAAVTGLRAVVRSMQHARKAALLVHVAASARSTDESLPPLHESVGLVSTVSTTTAISLQRRQQQQQSSVDSSEPSSDQSPSSPIMDERHFVDPASITVWSWPRVLWPAILMNCSHKFLDLLVFGVNTTGKPTNTASMGQTALCLALHAALLLGCYVVVNHQFLQQWLPLVAGREPVLAGPLASFLQLTRSAPGDVLWPFWWRPEFAAAAADDSAATAAGSC